MAQLRAQERDALHEISKAAKSLLTLANQALDGDIDAIDYMRTDADKIGKSVDALEDWRAEEGGG